MRIFNVLSLVATLEMYSIAQATIIHVPAEYGTIQAGIDASTDGDTVLVAPGTYEENVSLNGHRTKVGSMFLTTEDTSYILSTAIDGSASGPVVRCWSGEDSTTEIVGFTIQNGRSAEGGGISCYGSSPTIRNNLIRNNTAYIPNQGGGLGGGIYCSSGSAASILNNTIVGNSALTDEVGGSGGGIYCFAATIRNNRINGNHAVWDGGGIACTGGEIRDNEIAQNTADNFGGGIDCLNAEILGNDIHNNSAFRGGGISYRGSEHTISGNIVRDNSADLGGGIFLYDNSAVSIRHNLFYGDSANFGGGIYSAESYPLISNNTLAVNQAQQGHGIYVHFYSTAEIVNTIFWNENQPSSEIYVESNSSVIVRYCNVPGGWNGEGNIDVAPLFRDPERGDFHLMAASCHDSIDSPCIDAGFLEIVDTLVDCQWGMGTARSDLGAYGGGYAIPDSGRTIVVPSDYSTIQEGINASSSGDTILVLPGTYNENLNFNGRCIVLGSLYLISGDASFINSTIIDGQSSGSVITLLSGEDTTTAIIGFTLRHGLNLKGGGIFCANYSTPRINHNYILENVAYHEYGGGGGGIYCRFFNTSISFNVIAYNVADWGGGIACESSSPLLLNNTISENVAHEHAGGIYMGGGAPRIINTIFWNDSAPTGPELYLYMSSPVVTYSDIEGGWQGEGNINADPLFVDPENDDFHLTGNSPCIDAGDPDSPFDPDSTRADIGALFFQPHGLGIGDFLPLPDNLRLLQNYPNPFNVRTTITFILPQSGSVNLSIYDILGRHVQTLLDGWQQIGPHSVNFDASGLVSGAYFYRLQTGDHSEARRLMLVK